jgi:hypothetical protein
VNVHGEEFFPRENNFALSKVLEILYCLDIEVISAVF